VPDKSPAEKMRLKSGMSAAFPFVPEDVLSRLGVPAGVTVVTDAAQADFVLAFASTQGEAEARLAELAPAIGPTTIAWIAYPKGSKAAGHDVSRDTIWAYIQTIGFVLNANISIDETFSAVRFRADR